MVKEVPRKGSKDQERPPRHIHSQNTVDDKRNYGGDETKGEVGVFHTDYKKNLITPNKILSTGEMVIVLDNFTDPLWLEM